MVRWSNYGYFFDISSKSNHTTKIKPHENSQPCDRPYYKIRADESGVRINFYGLRDQIILLRSSRRTRRAVHARGAGCSAWSLTIYTVSDKEQTKIYWIRKVHSVPSRCTHATHVHSFRHPKCSAAGDREVLEVLICLYVLVEVICVCLCESLRIEAS